MLCFVLIKIILTFSFILYVKIVGEEEDKNDSDFDEFEDDEELEEVFLDDDAEDEGFADE